MSRKKNNGYKELNDLKESCAELLASMAENLSVAVSEPVYEKLKEDQEYVDLVKTLEKDLNIYTDMVNDTFEKHKDFKGAPKRESHYIRMFEIGNDYTDIFHQINQTAVPLSIDLGAKVDAVINSQPTTEVSPVNE